MEPTRLPLLSILRAIRPMTRATADVAFFVVPLVLAIVLAAS